MFIVTKRYGRSETRVSDFSKEQDAVHAIMEKLQEDRHYKLMATYCLYEGADLLREYTQDDTPAIVSDKSESDASSAAKQGSGKTFAPTPFNTTPRLGPQTWIKDDSTGEDDKDKNA